MFSYFLHLENSGQTAPYLEDINLLQIDIFFLISFWLLMGSPTDELLLWSNMLDGTNCLFTFVGKLHKSDDLEISYHVDSQHTQTPWRGRQSTTRNTMHAS